MASTTLIVIILNIIAWSCHEAKPLNLDLYRLYGSVKIGQQLTVTNLTLLDKYVNETFPAAFRTELNPEEYFHLNSNHSTYEEKVLQLMMESSLSGQERRVKRGISSLCPVNWVVEYESTRNPSSIWQATCNGQGSTCRSPSSGRPSCEHLTSTIKVFRFLGVSPNGQQFWRRETKSLAVGCSCSSL